MRLIERVLATESRLFDSILASGAERSLDEQLDPEKMAALQRHDNLIASLDEWVMIPDKRLYPALQKLSEVARQLYKFPPSMTLYRGLDPQSSYQNTMGLSKKGILLNTEKPFRLGELHHYESDQPISCTTSEQIAQAFGKVVIRMKVQPNRPGTLVITQEMAALVCQRRNIELKTQDEVILLPPVQVDFVIHAINR